MALGNPLGPDVTSGLVKKPAERAARFQAAQALLGHNFARPELLGQALTHRSAAGAGGADSNERLEFIGDRVLGLVVAEWLIERFPDEREGELGRRLAALVSGPALAVVAQGLGLADLLSVSPGEARRGVAALAAVLADGFEAMLGALFLDAGFPAARDFLRRALAEAVERQVGPPKDPKTALQEWALKRALPLPDYVVEATDGPSHNPVFTIRVGIGDAVGRGTAGSKRAAEQAAARALLDRLPP
jgi:ribonuclease-3